MGTDWLDRSIDQAVQRARELCEILTAGAEFLEDARVRHAGGPVLNLVDELHDCGSEQMRRRIGESIRAYEHAATNLRAALVRGLVEEKGMTLTAIAERAGISRQMAARVYQTALGGERGTGRRGSPATPSPSTGGRERGGTPGGGAGERGVEAAEE